NQGTLDIQTNTTLGQSGATHSNTGTFNIELSGTRLMVLGSTLTNPAAGTMLGDGTLELDDPSFTAVGNLSVDIDNSSGTVHPGFTRGQLGVINYFNESDGTFDVELLNPTPGSGYSQLN